MNTLGTDGRSDGGRSDGGRSDDGRSDEGARPSHGDDDFGTVLFPGAAGSPGAVSPGAAGHGDDPVVARTSWQRAQRTLVELRWPLLACGLALFLLSATTYYHVYRSEITPSRPWQQTIAFLYDTFGLAPLFAFCAMVLGWSSIWFWSGTIDRPGMRLGRLAIVLVMLGVFLNLGDVGSAPAPHKGALGMWLAGRLVHAIGYVASLLLVWSTTFAALLLATDFFWSDVFERLRRPLTPRESGVEDEVTEHLRGLAQLVPPPKREVPHNLRSLAAPSSPSALGAISGVGASDAVNERGVDDADPVEPAAFAPPPDDPSLDVAEAASPLRAEQQPPPSSYEERRRLRRLRREWRDRVEPEGASAAVGADAPGTPDAPRMVGDAADEAVSEAPSGSRSLADGEGALAAAELAALFGESSPAPEPQLAAGRIDLLGEVAEPAIDGLEIGAAEDLTEDLTEDLDDDLAEDLDGATYAGADPSPVAADVEGEGRTDDGLVDPPGAGEFAQGVAEAVISDAMPSAALPAEPLRSDGEPADEGHPAAGARAAASADEAAVDLPSARSDTTDDPVEESADRQPEADREHEFEEAGEADPVAAFEPEVDIPRPEVPPEPRLPTPPAVQQKPGRQQQLFGGDEDLVQEAIEVVTDSRRATATLLQRKLRVDYSMACDLLAELAARGVIAIDDDATQGRVLGG